MDLDIKGHVEKLYGALIGITQEIKNGRQPGYVRVFSEGATMLNASGQGVIDLYTVPTGETLEQVRIIVTEEGVVPSTPVAAGAIWILESTSIPAVGAAPPSQLEVRDFAPPPNLTQTVPMIFPVTRALATRFRSGTHVVIFANGLTASRTLYGHLEGLRCQQGGEA